MIPRGGPDSHVNQPGRSASDLGFSLVECGENGTQLISVHRPSARSSRSMLMGNVADGEGVHFEHAKVPTEAAARFSDLTRHHFGASGRVFCNESQQLDPHRMREGRRERVQIVAVLLIFWYDLSALRSYSGDELMVHLK